jgi:Recombinase
VSIATLDGRVVPAIATVQTEWGTRLIPVDELERFLDERRHEARVVHSQPARRGRKPGIALEVVARIRNEHAAGQSLGEIARRLNGDGVKTGQGGRQWWPSTVRAVLSRPSPLASAEGS